MNSILPLGLNHVEVSRYMTTAQIVIQMPFASQELNQEGGGYYEMCIRDSGCTPRRRRS